MKKEKYKNLKVSEQIFITFAYAFVIWMLIYLTLKVGEVPLFYFGLLSIILIIFEKVIPRNRYINLIQYACRLVYITYGIYAIYLIQTR